MIVGLRHPFGITLLVFNLLVFAYLLGPLLVIIISPFGETGYLMFPPKGLTLRWYHEALADPRFVQAFVTSVTIAGATTVAAVAIGVPASLAIVRYPFRGSQAIEGLLLSPLFLPTMVLALGLTIYFSRLGVTGGTWTLILGHLTICVPYVVRITIPALRRFDWSLEEAAQNLGASRLATFFLVTLPGIRPGIIAALTLAFIVSLEEIELAIFLASPRSPTLPLVIYSALQHGFYPSIAAVSALLILFSGLAAIFVLVLLRLRKSR